jgi:hypothetical protein
MDVAVEPVVVAVRVRPLSDKESKENAFSIVHPLPDEPKVTFILTMICYTSWNVINLNLFFSRYCRSEEKAMPSITYLQISVNKQQCMKKV